MHYLGRQRRYFAITIVLGLLAIYVDNASSRKLFFKEDHFTHEESRYGYFLIDRSDFYKNVREGNNKGNLVDDVIHHNTERKSRIKRNAFVSTSPVHENVSAFSLPDSLPQLLVHWARNNSDTIIVLTRRLKRNLVDIASSSNLYISYDYGRTFQKKYYGGNVIDKFVVAPADHRRVMFADSVGSAVVTTDDIGRTYKYFVCPFQPTVLEMHPTRATYVFGYDKYHEGRRLYLSKDFGQTWTLLENSIRKAYWGNAAFQQQFDHEDALYVERMDALGKLTVLKSETFFQNDSTEHVLVSNADEFFIRNASLFAVQSTRNWDHKLLIALDRHSEFVVANFPANEPKKEFFVVDVSDNQIMVLVSFGLGKTHLYVSEPNTVNFKLSLENVIYSNHFGVGKTSGIKKREPFADIHKVTGMRSVFIANTGNLTNTGYNDNYNMSDMKTVISYNKGATWQNIAPPIADSNGEAMCSTSQEASCSLQFTQDYHVLHSKTLSSPIITAPSSPGYILASGVAGNRVVSKGDLYFSSNAGKTWKELKKGEWYYKWADHGGIMAIVKKNNKTNQISYTIDEGHTWVNVAVYRDPINIYAILSEPGETSSSFTLFGVTTAYTWILINVDLSWAFHGLDCEQPRDYISWTPVSNDGVIPCSHGSKLTIQRRPGYNSVPCRNGRAFARQISEESCPCTKRDYECAKGFERESNPQSFNCISSASSDRGDDIPPDCLTGSSYKRTRGYQKLPGNRCVGGEAQYGPVDARCPVIEDMDYLLVTSTAGQSQGSS